MKRRRDRADWILAGAGGFCPFWINGKIPNTLAGKGTSVRHQTPRFRHLFGGVLKVRSAPKLEKRRNM
jgi:hypothetical protein